MSEFKEVSWEEAVGGSAYVKLEEDKPVQITITNWKLIESVKKFTGTEEVKIEFVSDVVNENGEPCEKAFNTVSNRLKSKLRAVLEEKNPAEEVTLRVTKIGDKFNTNYSVQLL